MTTPPDPHAGDPQAGFHKSPDSGSSPLSGSYDATTGLQHPTGYPSAPVAYPPTGTGQFYPASQPASYGGAPYDPASYSPPPYGQPPYAAPGYGVPYPGGLAPRNGMGTAALVLGIIAVVLSWTVYGGVILGILAVIFGAIGLARAKRGEANNRGVAMAGLVLGIVALALLVLLVIIGIGLFASEVTINR